MLPFLCAAAAVSILPEKNARKATAIEYVCDGKERFGAYYSEIYSYQGDYMKAYFDNLTSNFGYNENGSCGFIAVGMVLSYYDTYWNDNIIPEQYDVPCYATTGDFLSRRNSPGIRDDADELDSNGNPIELNTENDFHLKLLSMANDAHAYGRNFPNTYQFHRVNLLNYYLENVVKLKKGYDYDIEAVTCEVEDSDQCYVGQSDGTERQKTIEWIKEGYPVIVAMETYYGGHIVVAYDYDEKEDEIYAHLGFPGKTHEKLSEAAKIYGSLGSAMCLKFKANHYPKKPATDNYRCCDDTGSWRGYAYDSTQINTRYNVDRTYQRLSYDANITIPSSTSTITLNGIELGNVKNMNFKIADRTAPLNIKMCNFRAFNGFRSNDDNVPFIEYTGTSKFSLNIDYVGDNSLEYYYRYGRPLTRNDRPSVDLKNVANLYFSASNSSSKLTIKGANGSEGSYGNSGSNGTATSIDGRNGSTGGTGACGCIAVQASVISFEKAKNLSLIGGNGGNGGNGGRGGNGCDGSSGSNSNGGRGGDGGRGGSGGSGGYSGIPFFCQKVISGGTNIVTKCGIGGKGGDGGTGGKGGKGGNGAPALTHIESPWYLFGRKKTVIDKTFNGGRGGDGGAGGSYGTSGYSPWYENRFAPYFSNDTKGEDGKVGKGGTGGKGGAGGSEGGQKGSDGNNG